MLQLFPVALHVWMGVQGGVVHCCDVVQGFSGSGGSRLQPAGL